MELQPAATYRAADAMVCSIDQLASSSGAAILRDGGSAVDAAIATNAVLTVTSQHACGLGGDLFAVVAPPGENPIALNASGRAGSGADPERLRRLGHRVMPFRDDVASVTVPGCVDGWLALHERFGRLPLEQVLAPAMHYANDGFVVTPGLAAALPLVENLAEAAEYTANGLARTGAVVRRAGVARALQAIAAEGRKGFYEGEFGEGLLQVGHGEFTRLDLMQSLADFVEPISIAGFGARLWSAPPNSQGYITLASAFISSGLDLPNNPEDGLFPHLLIEAVRQASFDRLDVLAEGVDGAELLAEAELLRRRRAIDPDTAADLGDTYRSGGTTAVCVVDAERIGVSLIQSNAAGFGAHIAVPGTGIFLHNRGIGFSLEPGHVGEYGPGKRPPHTLCPTVVTSSEGDLRAVLGTMGSDSQPQILLQLLARLLHCGHAPGDALAAGRFVLSDPDGASLFDTWQQRGRVKVVLEGHAPKVWDAALRARGHVVERAPSFGPEFGHAHCIVVDGDVLSGAAEPRTDGSAVSVI